MVRNVVLALAVSALAATAVAQPLTPQQRERQMRDPFPLFVAPDGQPFRAGPNLPPPVVQWFNQVDADHDGVITREEFVQDSMNFFAFLDVDHDNVITGFENARYEQRVAPEITVGGPPAFAPAIDPNAARSSDPNRPAHHTVLPVTGAARFSFFNEPQPIRVADMNLDWQVTDGEWRAASERRFRQLTEGHNGRLALDTLPEWPDPRRQRRR
jgi:hypothetical protein